MIKPFADDKDSASIADLTVENGTQAVMISGSLEVTRDAAGLKRARALKELADGMVDHLQAAGDLPEKVAATGPKAVEDVANPFA